MNGRVHHQLANFAFSESQIAGALKFLICAFVVLAWIPNVSLILPSELAPCALLLPFMCLFLFAHGQNIYRDKTADCLFYLCIAVLCCLLFWGVVSLQNATNYFRAGRFFLSFGQGLLIVFILGSIAPKDFLITGFKTSTAMFFITMLLALPSPLIPGLEQTVYQGTDRLFGFFKNPNQHGMILSIAFIYSLAFLLITKHRMVAALALVLCVIALALAGSKTNLFISLMTGLTLMSYCLIAKGKVMRLIVLVPAIVLSIGIFGPDLLETLNPRAARLVNAYITGDIGQGSTVHARSFLWNHSIEQMANSPLTGDGAGQRIRIHDQDHSHSHNIFLDLGRTLGVPGLVLCVLLLSLIIGLSLHTLLVIGSAIGRTSLPAFESAMLVGAAFSTLTYIASNQMSDSFGPSTSTFFWLSAGLVIRRNDLLFKHSKAQ